VDQLTVASGPSLIGLDLRSSKFVAYIFLLHLKNKYSTVFSIPKAHESYLIDLDYNPNKPYHMITGGDDGFIRVWDSRQVHFITIDVC
jgi:WD40 repeat protein